jgi:hypothetical protein
MGMNQQLAHESSLESGSCAVCERCVAQLLLLPDLHDLFLLLEQTKGLGIQKLSSSRERLEKMSTLGIIELAGRTSSAMAMIQRQPLEGTDRIRNRWKTKQ